MGRMNNMWTEEEWRQHLGKQVKVHPPSNSAGHTGKLIRVQPDGFEVSLTLELADKSTCRPFSKYCGLVDDAPTPNARPQVKAQPDLATFFKGPTNYASCPKCAAGKLVPMFSGEPMCDQACERRPALAKLSGCDEYWATGGKGFQHRTLWEREDDARYWAARMGSTCGLYRVRLRPGAAAPRFERGSFVTKQHPSLKGGYSSPLGSEIELIEEVPV